MSTDLREITWIADSAHEVGWILSGPAQGVGLALLILAIIGVGVLVYFKVVLNVIRHRRTRAEKRDARRTFRGSLFEALRPSVPLETAPVPRTPQQVAYAFPPIMRDPSPALLHTAAGLGLRVRGPWLIGRKDGFPVAVREFGPFSGGKEVSVSVTHFAAGAVGGLVADRPRVRAAGLSPYSIAFDAHARAIVYTGSRIAAFRRDVPAILEAILWIAKQGGPPPGDACLACDARPASDVFIVDNVPTQLCPEHVNRLWTTARHVRVVPRRTRPNVPAAIVLGLVGMVLGAVLWAWTVLTMRGVVPLAWAPLGVLVAALVVRGAKVVTAQIVIVLAVLVAVSVFVGDIIWISFALGDIIGRVNPVFALQVYPLAIQLEPLIGLSYVFGIATGVLTATVVAAIQRREKRVWNVVL